MATKVHTPVTELEEDMQSVARAAVADVVDSRSEINRLNDVKSKAQGQLLIVVKENGEESIEVDGHVVSFVKGHERVSLSKDRVRELMLEAGISAMKVAGIIKKASNVSRVEEHVTVS